MRIGWIESPRRYRTVTGILILDADMRWAGVGVQRQDTEEEQKVNQSSNEDQSIERRAILPGRDRDARPRRSNLLGCGGIAAAG